MPDKYSSCLVAKLSHYIDLDEHSLEGLATLEKDEQSFKARIDVYQEGDNNNNLYVVKSGWLYNYVDLKDGRRSIVDVHHPGDVIGYPELAFDHSVTSLATAEDAVLCPFPKSGLARVFNTYPVIGALLFSIAARDQIIMIDRMRAVSCMTAKESLAYFLLDLRARLMTTKSVAKRGMRLPMNQQEIGDSLGITNVTVSRELKLMEEDGLIVRNGSYLAFKNLNRLEKLCEFEDRYDQLDASWFPNPAAYPSKF